MVIDPGSDSLFLANSASDSVTRIDLEAQRVVEEIPVGRGPVGIANSPRGDRIYSGNRGEGTLSVIGIADNREWGRIPVGEAPAACVVDPESGHLLVSNTGSGTVMVLQDLITGPLAGSTNGSLHPLVGRRLPDFALMDLHSGRLRHSREWSERKYILNFFASW
jgi:YVTN family beta-propeller protein